MITLTTPASINSVLGGNVPVLYDKLVLTTFSYNPVDMKITASITMTSTTSPDMQPITGNMTVWAQASQGVLELEVRQLNFYRRVRLSGPQATSIMAMITAAQTQLESGLVTLGVIAGLQSAGV